MGLRFMTQSVAVRRELILHGNPLKTLLYLSIPTLMMALVQSFIPITDGLFLNNTSSVAVASAVGFAVPIINVLTSISQGLSIAAMAILGQIFGQGDMKKVKHCASQTMFYSFLLGCAIAPLTILSAYFFSTQVEPDIAAPLLKYLSIYSFVLPFLFCAGIYNSIKTSMGQPEANFVRILILFILKLIFNSIFLLLLKLDEIGAVLASLCSYVSISIWMIYDLYIAESETKLSVLHIRPDWDYLKTLFKLAIPSMISSAATSLGFFFINMEIARFGKVILNAQIIASNINSLCFTLPSSISSTVTAMVSMNIGTGNEKGAKKVFLIGLGVSVAISAILIAIFLPSSEFFVKLFRNEPVIVEIAVRALHIYTWSIIGFGTFMVANGAFIGLGRTKMTLVAGILRIWGIRYLFIILFVDRLGVDAIFWGNLISNFICAIIFAAILLFIPWKTAIKSDYLEETKRKIA